MVSIVIPKNSLSDLINAGLACRYYANKGEKVKPHIIDEDKKRQFWTNIREYVDNQDGSLLILNFPLLAEEELKHIDLEPYDYSILYIPSKSVAVSQENRKILLDKGIASVPSRDFWKCYPGNYGGDVEKRWMELNKVISLVERPQAQDKRIVKIARGFLKEAEKDPELTIQRIAKNEEDYFEKLGESAVPKFRRILSEPDLELISTESCGSDLIQIAFSDALFKRKVPLGIKGKENMMFIVDSSTFANHIFAHRKVKYKYQMKFGGNAVFRTKTLDDAQIVLLLGELAQRNVFLKIGKPALVAERTLSRRLIGGRGPGGRSYRGIRDEFPELELKNNTITVPRKALEAVFSTLKETGTKYEIVT